MFKLLKLLNMKKICFFSNKIGVCDQKDPNIRIYTCFGIKELNLSSTDIQTIFPPINCTSDKERKFIFLFLVVLFLAWSNKPGTAQVGFISEAQKYSTSGNIWKFFLKVFGKKSRILPKNPKRDPLGSINVFTSRKLQNIQGVPFDRIRKFSKKVA